MAKIEKKISPKFFQRILDGDKTYEIRLADFSCKEGDILVLKEWDPDAKDYTGRSVEKKITYVFNTKEMEKFYKKEDIEKLGLIVIAFK